LNVELLSNFKYLHDTTFMQKAKMKQKCSKSQARLHAWLKSFPIIIAHSYSTWI
jgi:hypothetical protein